MQGREVFVVDAVRTPVGRLGGALAKVRPDDLGAVVIRALLDRTPSPRPRPDRRGQLRRRQPGRRGQPQRRPDVVAARRAADVGARLDGQPALRLRPRRGGRRRAHDRRRGRLDHGRRRRRVDDPGAVRAAQVGPAVPGRQRDDVLHDAGLADDQPGHAAGVDGQPRREHRAARRAVRRRARGRGRVRRPVPEPGSRRLGVRGLRHGRGAGARRGDGPRRGHPRGRHPRVAGQAQAVVPRRRHA